MHTGLPAWALAAMSTTEMCLFNVKDGFLGMLSSLFAVVKPEGKQG